jgi:hypothetical protein
MSKFKIPESLADLDVDGLLDLRSQARKAAAELVKDDKPSSDDIAAAEAIVAFITEADARITELKTAEQETADRLAAVRAASAEEPEDSETEPDVEPEGDDEDDEDPEVVEEIPLAEPETVLEEVKEPAMAASATKVSAVSRAAANAKPVEAPMNKKGMTITAAADIAGISTGSTLENVEQVTKAAMKRFASFPRGKSGKGTRLRQGIASFDLYDARDDGMYQGNPDFKTDQDVLVAAASERRLKGGALTAAGGWCAPTETIYDFCSEVSTDGILDLPSMTVRSGSIRYTKGPDFAAIFADADGDWYYSEAEVIADTEKPCIEVECPPWNEIVLDVTGVCVTAGILTQAAYPELVKAYIENVLIAHQHKVATKAYAAIRDEATLLTVAGASTAIEGLASLEFAIEWLRESKRMAFSTTVEVLLPHWFKAVIRADFANRSGVELTNVTDAVLAAHFANRGAHVQWLYNTGQEINNTAGTLTIEATVQAIFYTAGTWTKLTNDLITLDGIYDSTNIKTNGYTALFTEEGIALANLCGDTYKMNLPVCASGQAGANDNVACVIPTAATP